MGYTRPFKADSSDKIDSGSALVRKGMALPSWQKHIPGYLFLLPFFTLFFIFTLLPIIIAVSYSFTNFDMLQPAVFVGLKNFKLLFLDDDIFLLALKNTFIFAVIAGPMGFFMSFFMAWLINQMRMKTIYALAFYAPSITSSIAMSVIWLYFFSNDSYGLINNFLLRTGITTEPVLWLSDSKTILLVVIFISIWMSMGTGFLTFLAGLQNLSPELLEAGMIDGIRNKWQELFYITIPQLKPQFLFGAITSTVTAFAVFDIAIAVAGFPSPNYAAHTIVAHMYDYAFIRMEMGYATAVSVILFTITFVIGQTLMRALSSKNS
ncbi:MAG: carbohydrate ABC transporter permease [Saccharofermentanales bacterium]